MFMISDSSRAILKAVERRSIQATPQTGREHRRKPSRNFGGEHRPPEPEICFQLQRTISYRRAIASPREPWIALVHRHQPDRSQFVRVSLDSPIGQLAAARAEAFTRQSREDIVSAESALEVPECFR